MRALRFPALAAATAAAVIWLALPAAGRDPGTALPCRQPQLAAHGLHVFVACGTPNAILVARSDDGGQTFGSLQVAADVPSLALGNHRGPRIAAAGSSIVLAAVVGRAGAPGGSSGDVVVWRSSDRGLTWSAPVVVNDVPDAAREGLHALAADGARVVAAWLDLREGGTRLMSATSTDGGATWNRDHLVYASPEGAICPCCHPSLAVRGDRVLAMFRNDLAGARDMYVAESGDGGRTWRPAVKLGDRTWPLEMCPMDGGALALDREGVLTAWRRGESVFLARPGKPERELGRGANPVLAVTPNGPVVAWNGPGGLYIARGNTPPAVVAPEGAFAAAVPTPRGVVLAYQRGGQSLVRVLTP